MVFGLNWIINLISWPVFNHRSSSTNIETKFYEVIFINAFNSIFVSDRLARKWRRIRRIIELNENLKENNDKLAARNAAEFKTHNIKSFDIVGAIGAGKTLLLERIVKKISKKYRVFVICGDVTTKIDSDRIEQAAHRVQQINTGRECALNAYHIYKIISSLDLDEIDVLLIENVGNLICPSDFILQNKKGL